MPDKSHLSCNPAMRVACVSCLSPFGQYEELLLLVSCFSLAGSYAYLKRNFANINYKGTQLSKWLARIMTNPAWLA